MICTSCAVKAGKVHGSTDVNVAGLACLLLLSGSVESLVALGGQSESHSGEGGLFQSCGAVHQSSCSRGLSPFENQGDEAESRLRKGFWKM